MVDGATLSDVRESDLENIPGERVQAEITSGLGQFGVNPIKDIDLTRAIASNEARRKEKKISNKVYTVRKLFLQYVKKYKAKWEVMKNYPKQIKQKPAWFDYALSLFDENEISARDKKRINDAFIGLWDYRDRLLPERVMSEEESIRQYGINSPYYEKPEESMDITSTLPEETEVLSESVPTTEPQIYSDTQQPQVVQPEFDNTLGVRKITPSGDSFLSGYISPIRRQTVDIAPSVNPVLKPPQGEFVMGVTKSEKLKGGSGGGAFSIGASMLSGIRGGDSLQGIINQRMPSPPSQPVAVRPAETITVAPPPPAMQRSHKKVDSLANRKVTEVSDKLHKFRNIELPTITKTKLPKGVVSVKGKSDMSISTGNIGGSFKIKPNKSGKINTNIKLNKSLGNMSKDVKGSIGGVVGGLKTLKGQVRKEFIGKDDMKNINLKNIRAGKTKGHKNLDVLNQLKSQTKSQISRKALECKMIPKLKEQCDKVFTRNYITNEVSKFREEFKDISKTVPTVKGEKAKLKEVSMLGNSIAHGVDGVHVEDIRSMYKNSGTTKQMNIGMMDYDYSFVTGKKKVKPSIEYYEEE